MAEAARTSYDEIPYVTVLSSGHPDRLATVARLSGLEPAPVDRCRVLELGCGAGGSLISMAQLLPESRFVGIDLSARQVAMGMEVVQAIGLSNVELRTCEILNVDASFGTFDYVLCHGVYSWVPPPVQDKILAICADNLASNGIAFISYNTYPGWHIRGMMRDMMCFHARRFQHPKEQLRQTRGFLDFLKRNATEGICIYGDLLRGEVDKLAPASDSYIYHEYLEEVNAPVYFHEFVERATARGLQYLAETEPRLMASSLVPGEAGRLPELSGDFLLDEQYLDFVSCRMFRESILCHAAVKPCRPLTARAIASMYLTGLAKPDAAPADSPEGAMQFTSPEGHKLTSCNLLLNAALSELHEVAPATLSFQRLREAMKARLAGTAAAVGDPAAEQRLAELLLQCYLHHIVELHAVPAQLVTKVSEWPVASPLARLQARHEGPITNLRHRGVELNELDRLVLSYLDGSRDRAMLRETLAQAVEAGTLGISADGRRLEPGEVREHLAGPLEASLRRLAGRALLLR